MSSEEIVVKNEPVCIDKPCGRPIRSVKSSKQPKPLRESMQIQIGIKSEPKEVKKIDENSKAEEVKSEPLDLEKYRVKQEITRELEEQQAIERRNKPMQKASIAFLSHADDPAEPAAHVEQQKVDNRSSKEKSKRAKKIK